MKSPALNAALGRLLPLSLAIALATGAGGGCVQRRFTIRTNPPGAVVYVDDYEVGTTPVATDFLYYGTRKIRIVKDGYETLTVLQPFRAPWYQYPPLDFISENLVPHEIRDERVLDYQLTPQVIVPTNLLLDRAENLRRGSQAPLPPVAGATTAAPAPPAIQAAPGLLTAPPAAQGIPPVQTLPPPAQTLPPPAALPGY